ncbi:hypothetical protein SAMN04488096_104208 [Mesonia phycicola]|uniref:Competence protein CoiA-like family protein n=1 Tax=Mesonia phycicola TaxID=579105 RepID=A0A1M6DWT8_9FLAO|nr:hypothetical protein [Mesonia phycicola]SHI77589.1 hypothetical protein SAMN04488096_104208 [Mesonia phycicola]
MISKNDKSNEYQNDWAKDTKGEYIHISNAQRGLEGYYCLGCDKEMIAAKGDLQAHHFRHYAKNIDKNKTECVVASRNYRERIAKDILHRLKELTVPAVYKYPPSQTKGVPYIIQDSTTVKAFKVKSEVSFYEDENCEINFGQNSNIQNRYLLLRPDITFFNHQNDPILLVEFVINHKIDDEKRNKLKRLGINTVQIIIPKKPEPEIEKALTSSKKIKWVFNEIEANTEYIYVPKRDSERILPIDEDQRILFEESFKCRAAQINELIRRFKKCLQSEPYRRAEHLFEQEISRVKKATKIEQSRLEEQEARITKEVQREHTEENLELAKRGGRLQSKRREFQKNKADVEERFLSATRKFKEEQEEIRRITKTELNNSGTEAEIRERFRNRNRELREVFKTISEEFERAQEEERRAIDEIARKEDEIAGKYERLEMEERNSFREQKENLRQTERGILKKEKRTIEYDINTKTREISELHHSQSTLREKFKKLEEREREKYRKLEETEREEFRQSRNRIEEKEGNIEVSIREELTRELKDPSSKLPKKLGYILEARRVGSDYKDAERQEKLYQAAREFFKKGTWKSQ